MSLGDNLGPYGPVSGSVPVAAGPEVALQFQGDKPPSIFSIAYYRPYFDVDTSDVLERILETFIPFRSTFNEKTSAQPDMYGPFWICTTLIFLSSALGNIANYLSSEEKTWHLDISNVSRSTGIFYGYVGVVPLVLFAVLKYFGMSSGLVQLWCMYGYSLFIYIPCTFISVVPKELVRWIALGTSAAFSTWFLATNMRAHVKQTSERWVLIVLAAMCLHTALAFLLKLFFFV
ncbi:hypothetical protein CBR_g1001 [Chara braunii]|uniref:Protein YIP n=1 Tax=Chara braunii TaxID=69332 RepID=A0A388KCU2_CHABU|nr:hypothetical protein CBR_g1001 [Chara braunii]|eukprot:GBG67882.1 hypothetical protein CBR_g1001 [Chara braunii]